MDRPPQSALQRFLARLFAHPLLPADLASHASVSSAADRMPAPAPAVFCCEDTVGLHGDRFSVGIVDRTFGDVDSHDPHPQREYGEHIERHPDVPRDAFAAFLRTGIPPRGTCLVGWQTEMKTELLPEAQLVLLDRIFCIGDVVKRSADSHMSGTVISERATCTLFPSTLFNGGNITQQAADDASIRAVPSSELIHVHEFVEGGLVVYGDWVGRIDAVYDEVAVKLSNNSVVVVEDAAELEQTTASLERLSPGDMVKTKKGNLRRGRWRYGAFDPNVRPEGMVVETRTTEFDVQWLARSIEGTDTAFHAAEPPTTLGRDEFESPTFFKYDASAATAHALPVAANGVDRSFHTTEVAVGDRVRFTDLAGAAVKYDGTHTLPNGSPQGKLNRIARTETLGYDMNVFLVMQTHSQVMVQWQDLTVTEDSSSSLLPDLNIDDDDEVWPGELVFSQEQRLHIPDGEPERDWTKKPARVGIVQNVQGRDRIAAVRWFKDPFVELFGPDQGRTLLRPARTGELDEAVEHVSFYDICTFSAMTRDRGDFVLVHPDAVGRPLDVAGPTWFGEVVDLGLDGKLHVRLGACKPIVDVEVTYENVTLAYSGEMHNDYMNMAYDDDDSDSDEDGSDTSSFQEMWIEYEGMDGEAMAGDEEDWSTEDEDASDDESMPDLVEPDEPDTSKTTPEDNESMPDLEPEERNSSETIPRNRPHTADPPDTADTPMVDHSNEPQPHNEVPTDSTLPSFLILDTAPPADHHYLSQTASPSPSFTRRIAKEHKILSTSLPWGIFVRTWDSRLDLLRILLIGPHDTPYEYAPFLIDVHLPPTYPATPPSAFFHSWTHGTGPINPNLYEDGKICLSLLGTWHADERGEAWSPAKSTLLQVLVSILGLVLVKEPYYNEAGYEVQRGAPETRLSSALYTERAYFRARAFIVHALLHPVAPFESEIQEIYRRGGDGAPGLLEKAISAASEIVERSRASQGEGERDGLRRVSLGAGLMLEREVRKLEALREA